MVNGKNDVIYPVEQLQLPLFRLLGAAPENKRHVVVEGGHAGPRNVVVKESLDWLDRYLGPVAGAPSWTLCSLTDSSSQLWLFQAIGPSNHGQPAARREP
jgi:hypothetical protein